MFDEADGFVWVQGTAVHGDKVTLHGRVQVEESRLHQSNVSHLLHLGAVSLRYGAGGRAWGVAGPDVAETIKVGEDFGVAVGEGD